MKISLIDAVGMTITAVVGIIALTYGIVKGGMDLKTFGYIGILFTTIFPFVSILFWIDYFKERKINKI